MPSRRVLERRICILACALMLAGFLAACTSSGGAQGSQDPPTWQELLQILTDSRSPYTSWGPMPEVGKTQKAVTLDEQPHGDGIVVYANKDARKALEAYKPGHHGPKNLFTMEPGSILVKENYPSAATVDVNRPLNNREGLLSITVLWKPGKHHGGPYNLGQPLAYIVPEKGPKVSGTNIPKNPSKNPYLAGGDWFFAMFPSCCFTQKPEPKEGEPPPPPCLGPPRPPTNPGGPWTPGADAWGKPSACNVLTLSSEGFMTNPSRNKHIFPAWAGETVAGKAGFCQSCHNGATGIGPAEKKSYGDYIFKLAPFHPKTEH